MKILKYLLNLMCVILLLGPKIPYPYQLIKFVALFYIMWQLMQLMNKLPSKNSKPNEDED